MHIMPFLLHSITLDWSIGLMPEFRVHLTNSPISRMDQTPKPLIFFPSKSRFQTCEKGAKTGRFRTDLILNRGALNLRKIDSRWLIGQRKRDGRLKKVGRAWPPCGRSVTIMCGIPSFIALTTFCHMTANFQMQPMRALLTVCSAATIFLRRGAGNEAHHRHGPHHVQGSE